MNNKTKIRFAKLAGLISEQLDKNLLQFATTIKNWEFDDYAIKNADIDNDGTINSNKAAIYWAKVDDKSWAYDGITVAVYKYEGKFLFHIASDDAGVEDYVKTFDTLEQAANYFKKIFKFTPKFGTQQPRKATVNEFNMSAFNKWFNDKNSDEFLRNGLKVILKKWFDAKQQVK